MDFRLQVAPVKGDHGMVEIPAVFMVILLNRRAIFPLVL